MVRKTIEESKEVLNLTDEILDVMSGNPGIIISCALARAVAEFFSDNNNPERCMELFTKQVLETMDHMNKKRN